MSASAGCPRGVEDSQPSGHRAQWGCGVGQEWVHSMDGQYGRPACWQALAGLSVELPSVGGGTAARLSRCVHRPLGSTAEGLTQADEEACHRARPGGDDPRRLAHWGDALPRARAGWGCAPSAAWHLTRA